MGVREQVRRGRALVGAAALAAVALDGLTLVRGADAMTDIYLSRSYFACELTSAMTWEKILSPPVVGEFPHMGFGERYVPLNGTCLADGRLRPRAFEFAGEGPIAQEGGRYDVGVFKVLTTYTNPVHTLLFIKAFDVPACPPR
jgi:hypothetical protein